MARTGRHDHHQTRVSGRAPDLVPASAAVSPGHHGRPGRRSRAPAGEQAGGPHRGRHRRDRGGGGRRGRRASRGGRIVHGAWSSALAVDPGRRVARVGVHGRLRDHAAQAARGRRRQRGDPADAGHRLRGQRGIGLGSAGRTRPGHRVHVPPLHPAGRRCPAGRLVAAGRRGDLLGRGGPGRSRRRAGVREHPGRGGRRSRRRARRNRSRGSGSGCAAPAAARRARAARRMGPPAGIPAAASARHRIPPDHPGLGAAAGFAPASPVGLGGRGRPGPGQLARRRGGPGREHPRHRRHRPLARPPAGLRFGHRRAEPQHHARRARSHRGNAQPGPGRHRAVRQPRPGRGAALPPGQFLAGRTGRMARAAVATASPCPARHQTAPRPAMQPGRSGDPRAPRHVRPADKLAQRTAQEQDTRHDR